MKSTTSSNVVCRAKLPIYSYERHTAFSEQSNIMIKVDKEKMQSQPERCGRENAPECETILDYLVKHVHLVQPP